MRELLEAIGEDPDRPGLRLTPGRVADAYAEFFAGVGADAAAPLAKTISVTRGPAPETLPSGAVMLRDIHFRSMCEHHLLPFRGSAHIAYLPGEQVVGLGALPRVVDILSARPQVQERLGEQIADVLAESLDARGVLVVLDATHECVTMRGGRQRGCLDRDHRRPRRADRSCCARRAHHSARGPRMTLIMGIVNVTADSFSDGGRYLDAAAAIDHGLRLREQGADIIDVGGESTRPGAERVDPAVERERVVPVVRALAEAGAVVSIDTLNAATALAAVQAGASIVNDVSGGLADPGLLGAIAATGADVALGHWRGPSADMYARAEYADVVADVVSELTERVEAASAAGIPRSRIILDPGIGFGKKGDQNWQTLRGLPQLVGLGTRVLVGTSRKGFLRDALAATGDDSLERRDLATAVTSLLAAQAGVWAVRVHDVPATRDALLIAREWQGAA